jgi:hypothetical protein
MSNIEKIKAEIERLMKETDTSQFGIGGRCMCRIILDFIDSLPEEKPSDELEEAAESYEEEQLSDYGYRGEWSGAFIAGANWQKEQMLKDAVEGTAHPEDCEIWVNLLGYGYKYNDGDKVKIIIVKED